MSNDEIEKVAQSLFDVFELTSKNTPTDSDYSYPTFDESIRGLKCLLNIVLPGRVQYSKLIEKKYFFENLDQASKILEPQINLAIKHSKIELKAEEIFNSLAVKLPEIASLVNKDIEAAYIGDPAAHTHAEIRLSYPSVFAVAGHRIAKCLYDLKIPFIPRIFNEWIHSRTGIDIHPGATIGEYFFVDHGTGVVIGETAEIGNWVKIYQGVTLGAKNFPKDSNGDIIRGQKRHPKIEDHVVIYANSTILGGDVVIGQGNVIPGNSFITNSIPAKIKKD